MNISFERYQPHDRETLASFLVSEPWPNHTHVAPTYDEVEKEVESGYYDGKGIETFWIVREGGKVGFIRIYELEDENPLFDMRISEKMRGQGIGTQALEWAKNYVFEKHPHIVRMEGYTRIDNIGMRRVFQKCGFVKESQPRACWPGEGGILYDSVGYAVIRKDWENKTLTPVNWEME